VARYTALGDVYMTTIASIGLGASLSARREYDEARTVLLAAVASARATGSRIGIVDGLLTLAILAEETGDLAEAERLLLEAGALAARIEAGQAILSTRLRLGLVRSRSGRGHESRADVEALVEERVRAGGGTEDVAGPLVALAACAASAEDWPVAASVFDRLDALPPRKGMEFVTTGLAFLSERAGAAGRIAEGDRLRGLIERWS
jgi:hypothetical protein